DVKLVIEHSDNFKRIAKSLQGYNNRCLDLIAYIEQRQKTNLTSMDGKYTRLFFFFNVMNMVTCLISSNKEFREDIFNMTYSIMYELSNRAIQNTTDTPTLIAYGAHEHSYSLKEENL